MGGSLATLVWDHESVPRHDIDTFDVSLPQETLDFMAKIWPVIFKDPASVPKSESLTHVEFSPRNDGHQQSA